VIINMIIRNAVCPSFRGIIGRGATITQRNPKEVVIAAPKNSLQKASGDWRFNVE